MEYRFPMIPYWIYCMRKEEIPVNIFQLYRMCAPNYDMSIYAWSFVYSLKTDSKSAFMYFLEKLTDQERHQVLRDTIRIYCVIRYFSITTFSFVLSLQKNTLCFLILSMDEEHLLELFTVYDIDDFPCKILKYFLRWPFQELFLGMMEKTKDLCSAEDYFQLLYINLCAIAGDYKDYDYELCFMGIWQRVPSTLKIDVVRKNLLYYTLEISYIFKPILHSLSTVDKQTFISAPSGEKVMHFLIRICNWKILGFVFTECILSRESIEIVRKQCEGVLNELCSTEKERKLLESRILTCLNGIALKMSRAADPIESLASP